MFPCPEPQNRVGRLFRAPRLWEFNVCGASIAGIGGAFLFSIVGGVLVWHSQGVVGQLVGAILILTSVAAVAGLYVGNLASAYPYAIEVEEGKGLYFYAPFDKTYVDMKEIKDIKWSYLRAGWVVKLRKRRGLLKAITIHAAFGSQGRELALVIQEQIGKIE